MPPDVTIIRTEAKMEPNIYIYKYYIYHDDLSTVRCKNNSPKCAYYSNTIFNMEMQYNVNRLSEEF